MISVRSMAQLLIYNILLAFQSQYNHKFVIKESSYTAPCGTLWTKTCPPIAEEDGKLSPLILVAREAASINWFLEPTILIFVHCSIDAVSSRNASAIFSVYFSECKSLTALRKMSRFMAAGCFSHVGKALPAASTASCKYM